MICVLRRNPSILSTTLSSMAHKGVGIGGIVYVPIPDYEYHRRYRTKEKAMSAKVEFKFVLEYLIIDELGWVTLDKHAEELDNVGVLPVVGRWL